MIKSKQTNQVGVILFLIFFILHSCVRYYNFTVANNKKQHVCYKAIQNPLVTPKSDGLC